MHKTKLALQQQWHALAEGLRDRDPRMAPFIQHIGLPSLDFHREEFRALASSILSQQLATAAARTITQRFAALGPPFPKPEQVLKLPLRKLRAVGLSRQKSSYVQNLARAWSDPAWRRNWKRLADDELIARLTEVKGVGVWTAQMFLMFSLGRPDVLPTGDYGIKKGLRLLNCLPTDPTVKEMEELTQVWAGARSIGCWYLWKAMDAKLLIAEKPETSSSRSPKPARASSRGR